MVKARPSASSAAPAPAEAKAAPKGGSQRISQRQKDGILLRESFQEASRRRLAGARREVDRVFPLEREALDDKLAGKAPDRYDPSRAAKELEDGLFRIGRLDRISAALLSFQKRPAICEVLLGAESQARQDHEPQGNMDRLVTVMLANLNAPITKYNLEKGAHVRWIYSALLTPF